MAKSSSSRLTFFKLISLDYHNMEDISKKKGKMKVSQKKLVIVLDWGLFIVLNIVAAWFASGVFEQFFSKRSSFFQHEEKIDTHPVIVIEFRDFTEPILLDDVQIFYR